MKEYQLTKADIKQFQEWGFDLDEINDADRNAYTYEDWLNPTPSMGLFPIGGWGIKAPYLTEKGDSTTKGNGKLTLFILPESEGKKIELRKAEIVEGFVVAYLKGLISWFESQYEKSLEQKVLVENELRKIQKLLFEYNDNFRYHTYGEGFWLSFYTYAHRKEGSMCYWYERICINGEDATRAVSRHHATMTANELNSLHPETLHCVVAALAFHKFKKYLNDKLEIEKPIELAFEDWKISSDNWKTVDLYPFEFPINQPFERHLSKWKDEQYRYYSLSNEEYRKIANARNDIFERQLALFLQGQIEGFEKRYSTSFERENLVETELEKVNDWLKNKGLSSAYVFPNPNGGTIIISDLVGLARKEGEDANLFPHWYNELIVQGKDARPFIQPNAELPYPIAVFVLYKYKQFLENRTVEAPSPKHEISQTAKLKEKAKEHLRILSGRNVHGRQIMADADFQRLQGYVETMIEKEDLPVGLEPVLQVNFPNGHIIYLFYLIHKDLYTTKKVKDYFIDFLHSVFEQLTGGKATTKKKFSVKPSSWEGDLAIINR